MSVVEKPFLHMLPEVYPLPDVRVFRFDIDSPYGSPSKGPASVLPDGQWKNLKFNISVHVEDSPSYKLC